VLLLVLFWITFVLIPHPYPSAIIGVLTPDPYVNNRDDPRHPIVNHRKSPKITNNKTQTHPRKSYIFRSPSHKNKRHKKSEIWWDW